MNTFKKAVIATATVATLAIASAAPASAGQPAWVKPFSQGLGMGVGAGIGLGITNAILQPRQPQVIVAPQRQCYQTYAFNQFGQQVLTTVCN